MQDKENAYVLQAVEAASLSHPDKALADALAICALVLRGWTLHAAKHQIHVVRPRLAEKASGK